MNYVAFVKEITPYVNIWRSAQSAYIIEFFRFFLRHCCHNKIDILLSSTYFYLHNSQRRRIYVYQNTNTQKIWNFQSTSGAGKSSSISEQLFLRFSRSSSSAIRDATLCDDRGSFKERSSGTLRGFSTYLLRSRSGFYSFRISRLTPPTARTKGSPQAHCQYHDFHRALLGREQQIEGQGLIQLDKRIFQRPRPSSQCRTGSLTQKKIADQERLISLPSHAINLYETLRQQVLEGAIRPQGISAFLFHGMGRGLRILADNPVDVSPGSFEKRMPPALTLPSISIDTGLVRLLANMFSCARSEVSHVC